MNAERAYQTGSGAGKPQARVGLGDGLILVNILNLVLILLTLLLPSSTARAIIAVPCLVFSPGYTLLVALFPGKNEISRVERVVLSVVFSLVVVVLTGLVLNFSPWGIRMEPALYSISAFSLIVSGLAWLRKTALPKSERFGVELSISFDMGAHLKDRLLTVALVFGVLGALSFLVYTMVEHRVEETFSEFYILGQQDDLGSYPSRLKIGEEGKVRIGIVNQEGTEATYSIAALVNGTVTGGNGPVLLSSGETWESEVGFRAEVPGEQKVEFLLYRNGEKGPYRQLHLWVDFFE